jgi:diacylglycerol kinase family enzyme
VSGATWCAVLNPVSGGGRALRERSRIERALRGAGINYSLHFSEYAGHAVQLASSAAEAGQRHFIAIGGDGTLNELLNGALPACSRRGSAPVLALVPVGRGDDWARTHSIPRTVGEAVAAIARARMLQQDVGVAVFEHAGPHSKRYFLTSRGRASMPTWWRKRVRCGLVRSPMSRDCCTASRLFVLRA